MLLQKLPKVVVKAVVKGVHNSRSKAVVKAVVKAVIGLWIKPSSIEFCGYNRGAPQVLAGVFFVVSESEANWASK